MPFEWDSAKSARNKLKHGISFEETEDAIAENGILSFHLSAEYSGQEIFAFRGSNGKIYIAVTEPRGNQTRIITVHRSRKMEKYHAS